MYDVLLNSLMNNVKVVISADKMEAKVFRILHSVRALYKVP